MKGLLRASVNAIPGPMRGWIKHVPGVAGIQRWIVSRVLANDPFIHRINSGPAAGLRFEITLPQDKAIWAGLHEPEFTKAVFQGVRRGDVCYDIGGFRGYVSGAMALAGASRVFAFEPLPANQKALQRLASLNPDLPIEVCPVAVGDKNGTTQLVVMADASMGKLVTSKFQDQRAAVEHIEVSIRSLDSMVHNGEVPAPQLVKIDVEGAEADVLRGAAYLLSSVRPLVFLEAHSGTLEVECARILGDHGFNVVRLESDPGGEDTTRHLVARPK